MSREVKNGNERLFNPDDPLIGIRELRAALGCTDRWVRRAVSSGRLRPDFRIPSLRWRRSTVEKFLAERAGDKPSGRPLPEAAQAAIAKAREKRNGVPRT